MLCLNVHFLLQAHVLNESPCHTLPGLHSRTALVLPQYLIQDLFFTTVLAGLMGFTEPRPQLSRHKPINRVMSVPLMTSTMLQLAVVVIFQLISLSALRRQPSYVETQGDNDLRLAVVCGLGHEYIQCRHICFA